MKEMISNIIVNVLTALYQPFWFSVTLSVLVMFFYLYSYHAEGSGKGMKAAFAAWWKAFRSDVFFRKLLFLTFYTTMILFRTLFNRNMWANPLSDVMGGWWIWKTNTNTGEVTLTTECFENMALMLPFTVLLLWTAKEKLVGESIRFWKTIWVSGKVSFLFSLLIEFLQLFLRLGTFQLSDLFYNTAGGLIGGGIYYLVYRLIYHTPANHRVDQPGGGT